MIVVRHCHHQEQHSICADWQHGYGDNPYLSTYCFVCHFSSYSVFQGCLVPCTCHVPQFVEAVAAANATLPCKVL